MTLTRLLIARGCTRSTLIACAVIWIVAFGYSPVLSSTGSDLELSSQVVYATYVLSVLVTFIAIHSSLGRRCARLRLLSYTPVSPARLLGECAGAAVTLATLLALASCLLSQLAPWYRIGALTGRHLGAFACLALLSSWLALATFVIHLWLEPELSLLVALGVLFLFVRCAGLDPLLPDPTAPNAALMGELTWPVFLLRTALWLAIPLAIGRAGLR